MKSKLIGVLIISGAVFLSSLFIAIWGQSAIQQIAGLAVAQTATQWNNLKDAAVGDNLTNGVGALGCYEFDGSNWDRCRGDTTNGIDVDITRLQAGTITPADAFSNPTTAITDFSLLAGFNGTTWDRLRSSGTNADALATQTLGVLQINSIQRGWNGTTLDRIRSGSTAADGIATTTTGNVNALGYRLGWNGTTWDRARSGSTAADGVATTTTGNTNVLSYLLEWNGTTWDRARSGSTAADGVTTTTTGNTNVLSYLLGWNGTTWDRARSGSTATNGIATTTTGNTNVLSYLLGWNGTTWDRIITENDNANHLTQTTGLLGVTSHAYAYNADSNLWVRNVTVFEKTVTGIAANGAGTSINMSDVPMSKYTMIIDRTAGTTDVVAINLECSYDNVIWPGTTQSIINVTTLAVEPTRNSAGDVPCNYIRYNVVTIGTGNTVTIQLIATR